MDARSAIITALLTLLAAALSSFATMWVARKNMPALARTAEASWQAQMTAGFQALTKQYETANAELRAEMQLQSVKIGHLNGLVVELSAHIDALENAIVDLGGEPPKRPPRSDIPGFVVIP